MIVHIYRAQVLTFAKHWMIAVAGLVVLNSAIGCGGNVATDTNGGTKTGTNVGVQSVPAQHRAADTTCPELRAAGTTNANKQDFDECAQDLDCTAGINGRCLWFKRSYCSYDTCFSDSDCLSDQPCECRDSASSSDANSCVAGGNCRGDADCGPGGFCSPSLVGKACGYDQSVTGNGYFCHTQQDSCLDDSDCDSSICAFDLQSTHWICVTQTFGCY